MRTLLSIVMASLLLTACAPDFSLRQKRPDQLDFQQLEFQFPKVAQQQLENGIKVYLRENHELPLVELTVMVEGGSVYDPVGKTGLSQVFAEVLHTGGSVSLTPEELESELEAKAIVLSVSSSSYCYEINLSVHRDELQRGLEILSELLQQPRFSSDRLELARQQMLEEIHRKNDEPGSVARRLLSQSINSDHPFGTFPTDTEINSFTREDLINLHERFFSPENVWIGISGDINQAEIKDLFKQEFASWKAVPAFVRDFPSLPQPPTGQILLADKDVPQTSILMGHRGISKDNPDAMALRVANYILGGGGFNSRLMREVRSNRGLAYSVYSYFQVGRHLPGLFIAGSETKSQSTVEVVSLMRQLMAQIIAEPVSDAELELAKKSLINSFVFAFDNCHSIVSRKMRLDYYGYPAQYMETYRQQVADVTVSDVQRVARKYLRPDLLQIVLVGDSQQFSDQLATLDLPIKKIDLKQVQ
jgi:zinc protease